MGLVKTDSEIDAFQEGQLRKADRIHDRSLLEAWVYGKRREPTRQELDGMVDKWGQETVDIWIVQAQVNVDFGQLPEGVDRDERISTLRDNVNAKGARDRAAARRSQ